MEGCMCILSCALNTLLVIHIVNRKPGVTGSACQAPRVPGASCLCARVGEGHLYHAVCVHLSQEIAEGVELIERIGMQLSPLAAREAQQLEMRGAQSIGDVRPVAHKTTAYLVCCKCAGCGEDIRSEQVGTDRETLTQVYQ